MHKKKTAQNKNVQKMHKQKKTAQNKKQNKTKTIPTLHCTTDGPSAAARTSLTSSRAWQTSRCATA